MASNRGQEKRKRHRRECRDREIKEMKKSIIEKMHYYFGNYVIRIKLQGIVHGP